MKGHDPYSPSTGWSFTPDGNIINSHLVGYGLTRTNTGPIVMKKLRKRNKNQVWAIKNKSKQWEKTTLNSYRRDALCWPIMPDGSLNQGKGYSDILDKYHIIKSVILAGFIQILPSNQKP